MPSKDQTDPRANDWMIGSGLASSVPAKPPGIGLPERGPRDSQTERPGRREMSAQVQRLARRLRSDPDELAQKIPPDTLRRTKYPVLEQVDERGRRIFRHDSGIAEGRIAEVRK